MAEGDKLVLLERNWLDKLKLDWATIFKVSQVNAVDGLIAKYQFLFEKGCEHLKPFKASIQVREDARPIFLRHDRCLMLSTKKWRKSCRG